jgi:hypothetical protein
VKCGFAFASRFRLFRARIEVHQCESLRYWIWQSAKKCAAAQGAPERRKKMDENLRWEKLEDKIIRKDRYIDFREARYRLPNGTEIAPFYHYSGRDFVVIAAKDTEGKYICVRQYRVGIDAVTTEFPAGGIERGESALEAAKRELLEETGAVAERWTELGSFFANPTMGTSRAHCFLAEGCRVVSAQALDESECVVYVRLGEDELRRAMEDGSFAQAVHIALYYKAREAGEGK